MAQHLSVIGALNDQVTLLLKQRIFSGEMPPGSRVVEVELAQDLGVSRGTLRAALQQLAFEGLIVQKRFHSTFVAALSARDAYEIYTLRNTLEAMAARLAARRIDGRGKAALGAALQVMERAAASGQRGEMIDADYGIHRCIFGLTDHSRLQAEYKLLEGQTQLYLRHTAGLDYDFPEILGIHRALVEAIAAGDDVAAEHLARDHNTPDGEKMVALLRQTETNEA
ncbi:GntR family transcriptional regulator [Ferrovibrio sp. MS7]|uniref:GntR family transcriptional regulator n=1 Tax=Ferrovibrio plantarum TaxID=3119164 RepID=UPI003135D7B9